MLRKIQPCAESSGSAAVRGKFRRHGRAEQRGKTEEDVDEYQKLADEELIQKLRGGDERIMDYILEKYKPLVLRKANAMFLIGGDTDDLIQEGMIGLFKAIRDYRPEKESSFYHFAELCISRQMYTAIEASNRKKHAPLNSYVSLSEPESGGIGELLETSPEQMMIDRENVAQIKERIEKSLSDMEKEVLAYYMQGMNYVQIAEIMERSPKSIDNALQRIKNKLK